MSTMVYGSRRSGGRVPVSSDRQTISTPDADEEQRPGRAKRESEHV